jgi:hypothetical protein
MGGYAVINNGEAALRSPCRPTPSLRAAAKGWEYPAVVIPVVTQHYTML